MNLLWHIIKTDIARERRALGLWALLFVGQNGIGLLARHHEFSEPETLNYLQFGSIGLVLLQIITGYVLTARLVHADPLVGSTQFWRTRPLSAGRLLVAKFSCALLLYGLLPVLLLLPWWLHCDFGWRDILWTTVETVGWQLLVIAPAFLVASLTDDLGRVLLWTLLLVVGMISWIALLSTTFTVPASRLDGINVAGIHYTRIWLSAVVLVVGGLAIAAHQFLTRRFIQSVGFTVLLLGAIALLGQFWSRDWTESLSVLNKPSLDPVDAGLIEGITIELAPADGTFGRKPLSQPDGVAKDASLKLFMRAKGLPEYMLLGATVAEQSWSWGGDQKIIRSGWYLPFHRFDEEMLHTHFALPKVPADPETVEWHRIEREKFAARMQSLGHPITQVKPSAVIREKGGLLHAIATVPNSILAKMREEPPAYEANLNWLLFRPEVVLTVPMQVGVEASSQGNTFSVRQVNEDTLLVAVTRPGVARSELWGSALMNSGVSGLFLRQRIFAMNQSTGYVRALRDRQKGSIELLVGGVFVQLNLLLIQPARVNRAGAWVDADPEWRKHTTLVLVQDREVARFTRTVTSDQFEVQVETNEADLPDSTPGDTNTNYGKI